jgi:conjugal transfer mating pair stabilization protein TraG
MANPNPARFSTVTGGGVVDIRPCDQVYTNLGGRLPAQLTSIEGSLAVQLNPTLPGTAAAAVIAGQIQQAYLKNQLATAAATSADIVRQNAMLNAINDSSQIIGQKVNDPASLVLAIGRAQAVAQTNSSWMNFGKVAEEALPLIRNSIEAMCYALFPFVILLLFVTSGMQTMLALKSYLVTLRNL